MKVHETKADNAILVQIMLLMITLPEIYLMVIGHNLQAYGYPCQFNLYYTLDATRGNGPNVCGTCF